MNLISFNTPPFSDALRVSILLKTVYIEAYGTEGITFEFANFIEKRFAPQYVEQIIREQPEQLTVAYFKGNPVGVAAITFESTCSIKKTPVPELDKLYILRRFYGQGIGGGLLTAVEQKVVKKGYQGLNLEVYHKNERAIAFYRREGFITIGETDFPMEVNTYKNLVMHKSLRLAITRRQGDIRPSPNN